VTTALDREYSPSRMVPDVAGYLAEYARRSADTRADLAAYTDIRYGPATLDLFPAVTGSPLLVYVHGGFWQEMSKSDFAFPARGAVAAGMSFAALGYGLAPEHSMDEIVACVRAGVSWLVEHADVFAIDPARIHLCGHSAGAHLAAMALLDDRLRAVIAGAILLSGVYDLEPIRHTYVNQALGLDRAAAARNSPLHALPDRLPPLVVACGAIETAEFRRQRREFAAAARGRGRVTELIVQGRHHFDVMDDLTAPDTGLGRAVFAQLTSGA